MLFPERAPKNASYLFNDPLEDTEINKNLAGMGATMGYLFNDPLEDTEIPIPKPERPKNQCYLFNDPLEDTEMLDRRELIGPPPTLLVQRSVRGY